MVQGPAPDSTDQAPPRRRWRALAVVGGGLALAGLTVCGWGYTLARRELPNFLQRNLSDALGRPIKVGEFERFNPTGVRLGPSIVPPTEDDFSWVRARALEVSFNPLELLFTRTLRPTLVFVEPQVSLKQGFDGEWRLQPPQSVGEDGFFRTEINSLQIRNASLAVGPLSRSSIVELPEGVSSATLVLLENVNLRVRFSGPDNQTASVVLGGRLNHGSFQLRGEGQIDTRQVNLSVQAQQIPIAAVNPLLGGDLFVRNGLLSSNLDLKFRPEAADPLTVTGTARLRNGDIVLGRLPSPLQNINGTMVLNGVGGRLENSSLEFGPIVVKAAGDIDARAGHDLAITLPEVSLEQVAEALGQPLPVAATGRFRVDTRVTGPLIAPQARGTLANLGPVQVDRLPIDSVAAQFGANRQEFTLHQATLRPATGGTLTAGGQAQLGGLTGGTTPPELRLTAQTDLPLDGIADLYQVARPEAWQLGPLRAEATIFGPLANLQGEATWQLPESTFPGRGQVSYADRLVTAQDTVFRVGEGTLRAAATADLGRRTWAGQVVADALTLGLVSPQLRGTLDSTVQAAGSLSDLTPAGVRAQGQARFSHALPLALVPLAQTADSPRPSLAGLDLTGLDLAALDQVLPGSLSTRFAWRGNRLDIAEATTPNLSLRGSVDLDFSAQGGRPQIGDFDLAARLADLDVRAAYGVIRGPAWLRPRGDLDFEGTLRGTLAAPRLAGTLGLRQVGLNDLTLVEAVAGPVQVSRAAGASLDLRGRGAELSASLAPDLRPNAFRLASGELVATGQRRGNHLDVAVQNFELAALGLRPVPRPDLGLLGGQLEATATLDLTSLSNPAAVAEFALSRPSLGVMGCDRISGQIQYRNGLALLTGGTLQLTPDSQFQVTGSGRLFPHWQAQAEITTAGADFQALLGALQLYSYADFGRLLQPAPRGRAADLTPAPVGDPAAPLLEQAALAQSLREITETRNFNRANALLPSLDQLDGRVAGTLGVSASSRDGLAADFEFTGQNWAWGRYAFDNQFLARGRLRDQVLTLDPVEFRAADTRLSLVGDLSPRQSDLNVEAIGLPLNAAATLLESPVAVTGLLNLNAHLTGPYSNPNLAGQLAVAEASVNQQPLAEISSQFDYANATLSVAGRVLGSAPEPLTFAGTIPYALPFMAVRPPSQQMALRATLKDDALSLVNLLTPALAWGGGQATIDLQLGGTPRRPLLSGLVAFDNASFVSPWLGASLDQFTGAIQLQGTQIEIESLTGTLFDGSFALAGQLPLISADAAPTDPGLRLVLNDIDFNYANEVRSQVAGDLTLTRALLAPTIGGQVRLHNTQVTVGRQLRAQAAAVLNNPDRLRALRAAATRVSPLFPVELDHLRLALAPAQLKALPLLSLNLEGELALSGPVLGLSADGAIDLTSGWINTVTTEFFLEPSYPNRVVFSPQDALDPYLDVVLGASVPLQRKYNINALTTTTGAAEIPTFDPLASTTVLDELQIEARLQGQASRLLNNFTLVSTPAYSQTQLLSMITGGSLTGLGGAEPGLALGSNLLGAFTADSQDAVAQALGLQRLRLIGTTVLPSTAKDTLGFGVGATVGITENLSASLVQVLNQNQPLALTARYRIDNRWSVGGSTDANNQGRAFVEYRVNFQ
ncbi:MAG TPA: translocation/assembly module TamB domain-containing protein [Nodosilinea sp.]|nr:translocation/assembly module TamB domain-containing protein [Nodosilinea sp.]